MMSLDPTREEWLAARRRVNALWPLAEAGENRWNKVVVAILGACPPEPAPSPCTCDVAWDPAVGAWSAVLCTGCAAARDLPDAREQAPSGLGISPLRVPATGEPRDSWDYEGHVRFAREQDNEEEE